MENTYKELKSVDFVAQHMTKETKLCTKNMHTDHTNTHAFIYRDGQSNYNNHTIVTLACATDSSLQTLIWSL
jgi:hypothetical protein